MSLLKVSPFGWQVLTGVSTVICASAPAFAAGSAGEVGDIGQAIAAVAIFALLLLGLGKWAWKPIIAQIRQREKSVATTIERAQKKQDEAEEVLAKYNQRLEQVDDEIKQLRDTAREKAQLEGDMILHDARNEANKHYEQVKTAIEKARRDALRDLHDHTAELATEMAGKIIGRNLDTQTHRKIVADSLAEIRAHISETEK